MASDAAGNVIIAGYFEGQTDNGYGSPLSAGGKKIFIAKLNTRLRRGIML